MVHIPVRLNGSYTFIVIPNEDIDSNDTYSLSITDDFGDTLYLAENVNISDIANIPYYHNVSHPALPIVKIEYPDNYRTINGSLEIQWFAFDHEDGFNVPISLYYSIDNGHNWTLIEKNVTNNGYYSWDTTIIPNGVYSVKIETNDSDGHRRFDTSPNFRVKNSETTLYNFLPQVPATPWGTEFCIHNGTYIFSSISLDQNNESLWYLFDWGDGNNSGWIGPYSSNCSVNASYSWNTIGTYMIKVKARDEHGYESNWSSILNITVSYGLDYIKITYST
jgi:hypothetical protein